MSRSKQSVGTIGILTGAGIASGADIILIPEIPYDLKEVYRHVQKRSQHGKRFSIVVVAEGARPRGGKVTVKSRAKNDTHCQIRLGGVGTSFGV